MHSYVSPERFNQFEPRLSESLFAPVSELINSKDFGDWVRFYTNGIILAKFGSDRGQFSVEIAPAGSDDFVDINVIHGAVNRIPFSEIQTLVLEPTMELFLSLACEFSVMPSREILRIFETAKAYAKEGTKEMFGI